MNIFNIPVRISNKQSQVHSSRRTNLATSESFCLPHKNCKSDKNKSNKNNLIAIPTQYGEAQALNILRYAVTIPPILETPNSFKSRNGGIGFFILMLGV